MPTSNTGEQSTIYQRPAELLQNLIRFNTTNPPGNENECIFYIDQLLTGAGFETSIIALDPARPNLFTRLPGKGESPPLLLFGHVDVVTTADETWRYPPFSGEIAEGFVWGRGALDMKGGVAMMVAAMLRAGAEKCLPPGDVLLAVVSDEEQGGNYGARYLVENHASLFKDVRYAIGEFGGFSFYIGSKKFYPVMVAEKQPFRVEAIFRGTGGHPTIAIHEGAVARLGQAIQRLEQKRLPVHITSATRQMIQTISKALPFPSNLALRQLLNPKIADRVLSLFGKQLEQFEPLLHNTANVTAIFGADDVMRIPDEIRLNLACILLPGYKFEDILTELQQILGEDVELKIADTSLYEPLPAEPDMGLFGTLADILREVEPDGVPLPLLLPVPTDGRFFSRLGIQTYGFTPMNLPRDFSFWETTHAADERIPVEAMTFGTDAIYRLIQRFGK